MAVRKRPAYLVLSKKGRALYRTKKEIAQTYGLKYPHQVNYALISGFNIFTEEYGFITVKIFTCKDCDDYMVKSMNCFKSTLCAKR